ncbi:MAG: ATP-binding protein [Actinomycetota bacterium]|nr:ATP-binding protein [Actinomycetota bacterium]
MPTLASFSRAHTTSGCSRSGSALRSSTSTREAYQSLLAREPRPEEAIPASPASPPLVGRVAERQLLTARWRAAAAGGAHFVLLTGEAGIGKSRLVEELRSFCWHAGAVTAEARSYSATQGGCRSLSAGTATDGGASSRT